MTLIAIIFSTLAAGIGSVWIADALMRLEDLCMEARATPPKRLIASAVDIIVFIARREGGRVITEILEADEVRGEAP